MRTGGAEDQTNNPVINEKPTVSVKQSCSIRKYSEELRENRRKWNAYIGLNKALDEINLLQSYTFIVRNWQVQMPAA